MEKVNMEKNYYIIKAVASEEFPLKLPNFHILAKREDNVMKAHILDFDLWVFSQQNDDDKALENIFERAKTIVSIFIMQHLENDTVDNLYNDKVQNIGEWEIFFQRMSIRTIGRLKNSYKKLIKNPAEIMREFIKKTTVEEFQFDNLDDEASSELRELLARLGSMNNEKARDTIKKLLHTLTSVYEFKSEKTNSRYSYV